MSAVLGGFKRSAILIGLTLVIGVLALIAGEALDWHGIGPRHYLLLAAGIGGFCAIAILANATWHIHARLERLRGHIALAATNTPLPAVNAQAPDSIDRLYLAVADLIGRRRVAQAELDRRLEQILGALPDGIVAVTGEGLVSLANAAGRKLFGDGSIVGTSIYDMLAQSGLAGAMAESRRQGLPVDCRLETAAGQSLQASVSAFADAGGAVIRFAADQPVQGPVEHDLALHDRPPAQRISADTPLEALPALVLDTETTGLDPLRDRLVSLGAVRLAGARLLRHDVLDLLVNPGRQIPARSTAVHGISDLMVLPAPGFREVAPSVMAAIEGVAVIGHHTLFDLTILRRAARAVEIDWQDPPWLDTALLYSALYPEASHFDLDAVAARLGVPVHGRHTALGDALTTADLYLKMLPLLAERGITTLGQAMAFQMTGRKAAQAHPIEGAGAS